MTRRSARSVVVSAVTLWALLGAVTFGQSGARNGEWRTYGGDLGNTRYAPLDQINRDNFKDLEIAWRFKTDSLGPRPEYNFQSTPLMVNGRLFSTAGSRRAVVALDAGTGELLWMHSENEGARGEAAPRQLSGRGLAYWTDGRDERILYVTPGYRLIALDAKTGVLVSSFGTRGAVDLKLDDDQEIDLVTGEVGLHAAPVVAKDTIIIGAAHLVSFSPKSKTNVKGYVRAYDVRTGKRSWIFHTIPRPGEFGAETWDDKASLAFTGNTGVWAQISVDEELGLVYLPVELPTGDFYGGHRPGNGLFGESLVAVDLKTGKRKWHYQLVHHGIWDWDIPCAPILLDLTMNGKVVKAVAQPTKQSWVFLFDRVTGQPLWPIEERPVPQSDVPLEKTSPTQPFPTKPPAFDRQGVSIDDLIDFTPELRAEAVKLVSKYKLGPMYTPAIVSQADGPLGTLVMPSNNGGPNWPGGAVDPQTGILYIYSFTQVTARGLVHDPERSDMEYILGTATAPGAGGATGGRARCGRSSRRCRPCRRRPGRGGERRHRVWRGWLRPWADSPGSPSRQAAVGTHLGDRSRQRGDRLAGRPRRDAGRRAQPPGAERFDDSSNRTLERPHWHARHEDARDRRRARVFHDAGRRARRDAPCVRQGDRGGGGVRLHAGPADRIADDVYAERPAVSRDRDERRDICRRAPGVQAAIGVDIPAVVARA